MNKLKEIFSKYNFIIFAILTALFLVFGQGVRGYCLGGDTEAYYLTFEHHIETKPIYSLLMEGCRQVFGQNSYMNAVVAIQILASVICIAAFVSFVSKIFKLGVINTFIIWGLSLLPYAILLPEDVISHSLMTESLTYPLVYLFVVFVLKGIFNQKQQYFYWGIVITVIMTLIRGQMLFLMAPLLIAYVYTFLIRSNIYGSKVKTEVNVTKTQKWISLALFVIVMLGSLKIESTLCQAYEKFFFDAPQMSYSAQTLVQKALFIADKDDVTLFEDEMSREIFCRTYEHMMESESNYRFMTKELTDWKHTTGSFGENSYILGEVIEEVAGERGILLDDIYEREKLVLKYSDELSKKLIMNHIGRFLSVSISMMPAGFVSTVLFHKESIYGIIHILTILFYLGVILFSIILLKVGIKGAKEDENLDGDQNEEPDRKKFDIRVQMCVEYIWLVVLTSIINVVSANLIHMGLQRYQAYTLGLNWVGAYLLLCTIIRCCRGKIKAI